MTGRLVRLGSKAMLFRPAPAKLLSWNQKPSLSQHVYSFASLQHVWTHLSDRERESASGLSTASAVMPVVRFTCCKQLSKLPIGCFVQDLPTLNIIFGAWSVGQECMMSMFANECLLQDRPTLSANESTCGNIWVTSLSVLGWKGLEATSFLPAPAKLLAERSSCWVFTYIHSAACSKCEAASQRKWLRRI